MISKHIWKRFFLSPLFTRKVIYYKISMRTYPRWAFSSNFQQKAKPYQTFDKWSCVNTAAVHWNWRQRRLPRRSGWAFWAHTLVCSSPRPRKSLSRPALRQLFRGISVVRVRSITSRRSAVATKSPTECTPFRKAIVLSVSEKTPGLSGHSSVLHHIEERLWTARFRVWERCSNCQNHNEHTWNRWSHNQHRQFRPFQRCMSPLSCNYTSLYSFGIGWCGRYSKLPPQFAVLPQIVQTLATEHSFWSIWRTKLPNSSEWQAEIIGSRTCKSAGRGNLSLWTSKMVLFMARKSVNWLKFAWTQQPVVFVSIAMGIGG